MFRSALLIVAAVAVVAGCSDRPRRSDKILGASASQPTACRGAIDSLDLIDIFSRYGGWHREPLRTISTNDGPRSLYVFDLDSAPYRMVLKVTACSASQIVDVSGLIRGPEGSELDAESLVLFTHIGQTVKAGREFPAWLASVKGKSAQSTAANLVVSQHAEAGVRTIGFRAK